jgi:hypothetical protein
MPQPIARAKRERIVRQREGGKTVRQIAEAEGVSRRSVRRICSAWRVQGDAGLNTHYHEGARDRCQFRPCIYREAIALKRRHQKWGAGLIHVKLRMTHTRERLPAERTLQDWFRRAGLNHRAHHMARTFQGRGQEAHAVWEMDAKDHIHLGDDSRVSVVSIQDEYSGAALGTQSFPPRGLATSAREVDTALVEKDVHNVGHSALFSRGQRRAMG